MSQTDTIKSIGPAIAELDKVQGEARADAWTFWERPAGRRLPASQRRLPRQIRHRLLPRRPPPIARRLSKARSKRAGRQIGTRCAGGASQPSSSSVSLSLAVLVLGGFYYWYANLNIVSTDDAYTDGRVVTIAPQVSGLVVSLDVTDNQYVHKGDPLIHIDPRSYTSERDRAQGALDSAKAQAAGATASGRNRPQEFPRPVPTGPGPIADGTGQFGQGPGRL